MVLSICPTLIFNSPEPTNAHESLHNPVSCGLQERRRSRVLLSETAQTKKKQEGPPECHCLAALLEWGELGNVRKNCYPQNRDHQRRLLDSVSRQKAGMLFHRNSAAAGKRSPDAARPHSHEPWPEIIGFVRKRIVSSEARSDQANMEHASLPERLINTAHQAHPLWPKANSSIACASQRRRY